jgi:hypothetical protein
MSFICTVGIERAPANIVRDGNTFSLTELVGFDDKRDVSYFVLVTLAPMPGGDMELTFCLVEHEGETDAEHLYWSGKDVARFIPREDRKMIMGFVVAEAVRDLVQAARPTRIFRLAMDENPPPRALAKHLFIAQVIESCGYKVSSAEFRYGRHSWWMERVEGQVD